MRLTIPVIRIAEVGHQVTTTTIYGRDPVTTDHFIYRPTLATAVLFDKDLKLATRATHLGHLSWKSVACVTVVPVVAAASIVGHVASAAWDAAVEVAGDIPSLHAELVSMLRRHANQVVNPK